LIVINDIAALDLGRNCRIDIDQAETTAGALPSHGLKHPLRNRGQVF
jgi:hypothetical protein